MSLDFPLDPFLCSGPFTRDVIQLRIKRQFYTQIETVNWICVVTFASICAAWRKSARVCHSFHLHGLAAEIHGTGHVTWGGAEQGFVPTTQSVFVVCGFNVCIFSVAKS